MVSTRQMSTTLSTANNNVTTDESVRLSVVTRQTSSSSNNNNNNINNNSSNTMSSNVTSIPSIPSSSSSLASSTTVAASTSAFSRLPLSEMQQQQQQQQQQQRQLNLLDLPTEILGKIFSYVGYKKVGHMRVISHKFNDVCMHVLNSTFSKLITQTLNRFQAIKASMPRRESARRNHHLATECDIIETCYMRLSLLQMTFGKRIERGHCCFFPGAILDEVYTVLNYIRNTPRPERPYRVTDELFDLSTMAMEYFRDKIEPKLPDIAYFNKNFFALSTVKRPALIIASDLSDNSSNISSPPQSNMVLRKGIRKIKQGMKMYNNQLSVLRNELRTWKRKASEQGKQIAEQQKILAEQQKQTLEYANRLDENDKKNEEMSRKFSTLLQELNKCKTELQYWRSKSPATPTCTSCGQKTVCTLPLEEYNALINQGVKPEDIILNIDDADENDGTTLTNDVCEFVFPDESTTTKLLAVSKLTKNLKRQHENVATAAVATVATTVAAVAIGGGGGNGEKLTSVTNDVQSQSTSSFSKIINPSQMNNNISDIALSNSKVTVIVSSNYTSNCSNSSNNSNTINTSKPSCTDLDLNLGLSLVGNDFKNSNINIDTGKIVFNLQQQQQQQQNIKTDDNSSSNMNDNIEISDNYHQQMEKNLSSSSTDKNYLNETDAGACDNIDSGGSIGCGVITVGNNEDVVLVGGGGGGGSGVVESSSNCTTEDVTTLGSITSNETKKARRVQKTSRFSSGNGKRKY